MQRLIRNVGIGLAVGLVVGWVGVRSEGGDDLPPAAEEKVDFLKQVRPLFVKSCVRCHGPEKQEGGLRLDRRDDAFRGGDSGKVFEPGKSAESLLVEYISGLNKETVMPPEGARFTAKQVGLIRGWIDQGADWPDESK